MIPYHAATSAMPSATTKCRNAGSDPERCADRSERTHMQFYDFALACERLAATTKKLEKAALLKVYFATLPDDDLALAARFLAGRPFALADERVLNVGWAVVRDAICAISGSTPDAFGALSTRMGEAGAAAEIALAGHAAPTPTLALAEVAALYTALAGAR